MTDYPTNNSLPSSPTGTQASEATPEEQMEAAPVPSSSPVKRRSRSGGSPNMRGGRAAARQNFSMHPELMRTILDAAHELGRERSVEIVDDRARRITYSKIVAALVWLLKTRFMNKDGHINDDLRRLVADYEASFYERPDDARDPDAIMESRRLYAAGLSRAAPDEREVDYTDRDEDEDEDEDED